MNLYFCILHFVFLSQRSIRECMKFQLAGRYLISVQRAFCPQHVMRFINTHHNYYSINQVDRWRVHIVYKIRICSPPQPIESLHKAKSSLPPHLAWKTHDSNGRGRFSRIFWGCALNRQHERQQQAREGNSVGEKNPTKYKAVLGRREISLD